MLKFSLIPSYLNRVAHWFLCTLKKYTFYQVADTPRKGDSWVCFLRVSGCTLSMYTKIQVRKLNFVNLIEQLITHLVTYFSSEILVIHLCRTTFPTRRWGFQPKITLNLNQTCLHLIMDSKQQQHWGEKWLKIHRPWHHHLLSFII